MIGELAAMITAILWSGTAICFSEGSNRVGPIYVNITRMVLALFYLAVTLLFLRPDMGLSMKQILNLSVSGFIGLVVGDTFLFKAFRLIGARLSMLIMALVPAISAFLAFFFLGEKIMPIGLLGMLITIAGIALVVLKREERPSGKYKIDYTGIFYAFMGAVGQAVGLIYAKFALNEGSINSFLATSIRLAAAVLILYPLAAMTKRYTSPVKVFMNNKRALAFTSAGAFIGPFLGITFSIVSISNTQIGIASTIMATVPIIMLPMVRVIYREKLSWAAIAGAVIAVGGIGLLFVQ